MKILVTGAAGFIGSFLVKSILKSQEWDKAEVLGLDSMSEYYDVRLKESRLKDLKIHERFSFVKGSICDKALLERIFKEFKPEIVVNLAAQAGVRDSINNPEAYIDSNILGFFNVLEVCRHAGEWYEGGVRHLVYASSSSVYGEGCDVPYSVDAKVDRPVSLYAATKKCDELMAHAYSKLYDIPCTGLRFFTVYGPAGRPDMAYFGFTEKLVKGETIKIYNYGNCLRDFTYIDDVVEGIMRVMSKPQAYTIYNIGNNKPEKLLDFVEILKEELILAGVLEENFDLNANMSLEPMQPGDVEVTCADISKLEKDFGFKPKTSIREGLKEFAKWYKEFYYGSC
jgi:nucleoside-diphosphate-sugar epimerase